MRSLPAHLGTTLGALRVALVHDWLVAQRGGENVLAELASLFPHAPIYTLVHQPGLAGADIEEHRVRTSFVQHLPLAPRRFRHYLPLFPAAVAAMDLRPYDLVISSSHCVAKAVRTTRRQVHIAYIHTPMRYAWDQLPEYLPPGPAGHLLRPIARMTTMPLRRWDSATAQRPDVLLANSAYVAERIRAAWHREATVLHPPVDVEYFAAATEPRERQGYLVASALVPYKRIALAVQAATRRGVPLRVIGRGPELSRLQRLAGPTVELVPEVNRAELRQAYATARALLHCGVEDFGIAPVEAMAAGCPVIGLRRGGLTETVTDLGASATGVFFDEPEVDAVLDALDRFEAARRNGAFSRSALESRARLFEREQFVGKLLRIVESALRTREIQRRRSG